MESLSSSPLDVKEQKSRIRELVWRAIEKSGVARFPRPVHSRIPNFEGSELAASKLAALPEFKEAKALKVNPDAPQRMVRYHALAQGKLLLMPTPRLRKGFILIDPKAVPAGALERASTIGGASQYGLNVSLEGLPRIDLVVMGSVAVSLSGARLGKGEGYGELEYGILNEMGVIDEKVKVLTSVHDLQIVEDIPFEEHDVPVDIIITPTKIIETNTRYHRPKGIAWERLAAKRLEEMPILRELYIKRFGARSSLKEGS